MENSCWAMSQIALSRQFARPIYLYSNFTLHYFLRAVQAVPGRFSPVCLMNEGRETPAGRIPRKRLSNLGFLACRADFGDAVHRAMDLILAAAGQICIESPPQTHVHHLYSNYTLHAFYTYNFGQKRIKW